ncbi:putative 2-aminoethylphosphonate ABC transporter permease subunit [Bacillus cytotoxicus]|uniref:Binding-protein-dependent transport systems inner membrane component n=1 Tax=Bacillus cytotoxicus (strain DSM 22905 / CIP 110041 / 391-98 / NVH 391-98) TaxID=315749 RepID=A7GML8_BACCN|nr:putative 2-aminoethylphosphonate ABC transporter permease subunit [Bacillus cytotoxicus]ABS21376.1 binding-protein-dependent transport systems inner membrane component [Bacillus cytotoxicus NVH 391-98]MDH2862740.1 putative 2-aminoethylphosphonate ABC transporter permease subunit [Bacillus cytotoxicus]MDH2883331.1 putative 2-aminoethylphosphonate ABC transporter permease subunit [Bacillus cytotoxicus]NZD31501.1 putative 2-aminoethylphosphonate ABC transporter permease subunit [Bacillus cytoto
MDMLENHKIEISEKKVKRSIGKEEGLQRLLIFGVLVAFLIMLVLPLLQLFTQAFYDKDGTFVGVANFSKYFTTPTLIQSLQNTVWISGMTTVISVTLAFMYAYAIARTNVLGKRIFQYIALLPLFAPTMLHGIALTYLFGNQGLVTKGLFGLFEGIQIPLYGPVGITIAEVIYTFPQAFLILFIAFQGADYRLHEASNMLGASKVKQFFSVTLPGVKYGLVSAMFVVFTLSFTDFGAPKIVGGQYNVLATDVYKQVIGQQNMPMGATVGMILLLPAIFAFMVDRITHRKQETFLSSKAVPYRITPNKTRDIISFMYCTVITLMIILLFVAVGVAASVKVWPYNMTFTLEHFNFSSLTGDGIEAFKNSVIVSCITAVIGAIVTFVFAYIIEKIQQLAFFRKVGYFFSIIPLAIPGLVLGLGYVFFFSQPTLQFLGWEVTNPFHSLYGTIALLVLVNIIHFYAVTFVTATTALKKLDREFELVSQSLSIPFHKMFFKVTVPMCLPAILEMVMYYFVNSMVTVSAVVFLYAADFKLAAVSIVNMDDAGNVAPAAAMSVLIVVTNIVVRAIYEWGTKAVRRRTSLWQKR